MKHREPLRTAPVPSGRAVTFPAMQVREFEHGQEIDQVLLVRDAEVRPRRSGGDVLRLTLGDRTGGVTAMVLEDVAEAAARCERGTAVHVTGRFELHPRWGAQIALRSVAPAEPGTYDPAGLHDGPPRSAEAMEQDLRELVATVQDPHLRRLLDAVFGEGTETWERFRRAPAAKRFHQAYAHGLLEHSLTVAQAVSAISATFPGIDRDVAVTGALLHDIGKLEAYTSASPAIDMTDAGRLQGEIPLGYYLVRRLIEDLSAQAAPFPAATAQAVLHIILSHHGSLEHGSPVVPCTREATLVHFCDNLGGRLGSFDRLEKELPAGSSWSAYDRALGSGAYFGPHEVAPPAPVERPQAA
jgi:3'-5' exoribonuclease